MTKHKHKEICPKCGREVFLWRGRGWRTL